MNYETATQIGVDLIAPAVTIFTIWYAFRPWRGSHIGRAIMVHSFGSMLLFNLAFLEPWLPENFTGEGPLLLTMLILWIIGWWYMVYALWLTRRGQES